MDIPPAPLSPGKVILYESQLHMIKEKILVSWKKLWFTLAQMDPFDPLAVDLTYYTDAEKKEKKGSICIGQITKVNPTQGKAKEHIFSIETHDKKYVLKASDDMKKTMWIAKLLECCSKDRKTFHISIPSQPTCGYREAIIKLSTPLQVDVVSPLDHTPLIRIPFDQIRRFGCKVMLDSDLVWFESCNCKGKEQQLYFFTVASGIDKAYQIVQDLKRSMEITLRALLIREEGNTEQVSFSYITRTHYGCDEYSALAKENVLHAGLMHLAACHGSGGAISIRQMNHFMQHRPSVPSMYPSVEVTDERRHTMANLFGSQVPEPGLMPPMSTSPRHSPVPSRHSPSHYSHRTPSPHTSPLMQRNQRTLASLRPGQRPMGLSNSAGQAEFDSGITLEAPDLARFSAPSYSNAGSNSNMSASMDKRCTLEDTRKMKSFDEKRTRRKVSLADIQKPGGSLPRRRKKSSSHDRNDSAMGSSADLIVEEHDGRYPGGYDRLPPPSSPRGVSLSAYDHLDTSFKGLSLKNTMLDSKKKHRDAYVDN